MNIDEFREYMKKPASERNNNGTKCKICNILLDHDITGIQRISDGHLCDDCYYESMGNEIDEHPIINPVMISKRLN